MKILIVDDDLEIRNNYKDTFLRLGFEVVEADDGLDGLDKAIKESPDVIFTGIMMPRMDGFSMMESLKKNVSTSKIPVVISSHMGRAEDEERAKSLGAKDFIVKNANPTAEVGQKIKNIFKQKKYKISIDNSHPEAKSLASDLGISGLKCKKCGGKMLLSLTVKDAENFSVEGKLICSECHQ